MNKLIDKNYFEVQKSIEEKTRENEMARKKLKEEEEKIQIDFSNKVGKNIAQSKKIIGFIKRYILIGIVTGAPGIAIAYLCDKFEDQQVGLRLALIGSIRDEILNQDEMAIELIEYLKNHYQGILADRYQVDENEDKVKILEQIALNRNCKMKGNELDYEKASKIVLEEFRNGKLGKISLETPEEGTKEA